MRSLEETDHTTLESLPYSLQLMCVSYFKSPDRGSEDRTYGLMSLSEKTLKSNHLQILEQRQHLLLNYFKTLSVGPAWNLTQGSHMVDWELTNQANQTAVQQDPTVPIEKISSSQLLSFPDLLFNFALGTELEELNTIICKNHVQDTSWQW